MFTLKGLGTSVVELVLPSPSGIAEQLSLKGSKDCCRGSSDIGEYHVVRVISTPL